MSIRVQCGGCGTVMTVRDDYAGTERRCPKCKGKFQIPTLEQARAAGTVGDAAVGSIAGDDFDPVAFLTGEKPSGKGTAATGAKAGAATGGKPPSKPDFDPMDILGGAKSPAAKSSSGATGAKLPVAGSPPAAPPAPVDDFDPMAVLADSPSKTATTPAAASLPSPSPAAVTPTAPEKPQPRRPSWAKPSPEPEQKDWEEPAPPAAPAPPPPTAPERPQPKRPSWAKAAPAPEKNDWDDPPATAAAAPPVTTPDAPQAPQPKRPSWAKPLPGELPAAGGAPAADASPAALAAAEVMAASVATVSGDNPLLKAEVPRGPWIDPPAIAAWFRRRTPLFLRTIAFAVIGFGASWWLVGPQTVTWKVIGKSEPLTPAPVFGKITVDGKPVPNARVMFHPRGRQYRSPEGRTDAEGRFELRFCDGEPGAPPGYYRVQLQLIEADGRDAGVAADDLLRDRSFEVPPGGGSIDIALETKTKK